MKWVSWQYEVEGLPVLNRSIWFFFFPCLSINLLSQSPYCTDLSVASMRRRLKWAKFSTFSLPCHHRIIVVLRDAPQICCFGANFPSFIEINWHQWENTAALLLLLFFIILLFFLHFWHCVLCVLHQSVGCITSYSIHRKFSFQTFQFSVIVYVNTNF